RYAGRLRRLIDTLAPDVVHSNSLKLHLLTALAHPRLPLVVWHMHDFPGGRALARRALLWAARRTNGVIAVSESVATEARKLLAAVPAVTVLNGIDTERFSPAPDPAANLDVLAGLPVAEPGTVRVGLVATYATWKGHDVFLAAARQLSEWRE